MQLLSLQTFLVSTRVHRDEELEVSQSELIIPVCAILTVVIVGG